MLTFSEIRIPKDRGKPEECPLLRSQREDVEGKGDEYEWVKEFVEVRDCLNLKTRTSARNEAHKFNSDLCEKLFFKRWPDAETEGKTLRFLDKIFGVDSEFGGAPPRARTLIVFFKLGRGIPYEVILKEEREAGASFETARKRVYRALKLRDRLGFKTEFTTLEEWEPISELMEKGKQQFRRLGC